MRKNDEPEIADGAATAAVQQGRGRRDEPLPAGVLTGTGMHEPAPAEVDALIAKMEQLYSSMTGQSPPHARAPYAPIPIETEPLRVVEHSLDQLIAALSGAAPAGPAPVTALAWTPPVTVLEGPQTLVVAFDLPGVERDDVQVTLEGDTLLVHGRVSLRRENLRLRASERPLGPFQRRLVLPPGLRGKAAKEPVAELRDGRLELRFDTSGADLGGRRSIPIR